MTEVDTLQGALDMPVLTALSTDTMRGFVIALYYRLTRTGRKLLEGEVSSYNRLTEAIAMALQTA